MGKEKTVDELAEEVGISSRQLARNISDGCPKTTASEIIDWRSKNVKSRSSEEVETSDLKEEILRAQLETERQRGRKLDIENRKLEGELIEIETVQKDIASVCVRMRSRLMGLGAEIAAMVPGEIKGVTKTKVEHAVRLALKEIAEAGIGE